MKKINLLLLGLVVCVGLFTSCSDDDDKGVDDPSASSAVADASVYEKWTYFNFETGKSTSLDIKGVEGAATGVYYGTFARTTTQQDSVKTIISIVSADTVLIEFHDLRMKQMDNTVDTVNISGKAIARKDADKWVLTGIKGESKVGASNWTIELGGTVGLTKGSEFSIKGTAGVTAMVEMGVPASPVSCNGKVADSKTYIVDGDETSFDWDIAFHKYDIRTNGGSAIKTDKKALSDVVEMPTTGFVADEEGSVVADMSQMFSGFVGYQNCMLNKALCSWITKERTGTMPPYIYTLNPDVFIVKTKAGKYAKIIFTDHTNDKEKAVYAAFDYVYPVK